MGEYDNAGFPVTYLLLSTAWDQYDVIPIFIRSDKDMGEIGCAKSVW